MGYQFSASGMNHVLSELAKDYLVYAPKNFVGGNTFSDTDCIRYGEINSVEEIVFDKKAQYSFKEVLTPISQTLFFFTEDQVKEANGPQKGAVIFLRSCDLHALKRLDQMYLHNGPADHYYTKLRPNIKVVLMGCPNTFDNCFCVSMETNVSTNYDFSIDVKDGEFFVDCKDSTLEALLQKESKNEASITPCAVTENKVKVNIPQNLDARVAQSKMWDEYDGRCISCGRCNFVCPSCTCFTMQDLFYSDNGKVGERRRVWASCMVDGFTDVAGGGSYRQKNGQRMRFKVLHKVLDFKQRNGYHMCVGCGRCDDVCPEYISFSNCINKLEAAMEEVTANEK